MLCTACQLAAPHIWKHLAAPGSYTTKSILPAAFVGQKHNSTQTAHTAFETHSSKQLMWRLSRHSHTPEPLLQTQTADVRPRHTVTLPAAQDLRVVAACRAECDDSASICTQPPPSRYTADCSHAASMAVSMADTKIPGNITQHSHQGSSDSGSADVQTWHGITCYAVVLFRQGIRVSQLKRQHDSTLN